MNCLGKSGLLAWFAFAGVAGGLGQGQTAVEHVVHTFGQFPDGANPFSTISRDSNGNLYGTANIGGTMDL
jgi:hypothetical protein